MPTREEKIAELRRRDKINRLQQRDAMRTAEPEGSSLRDKATAVTQGASWNWGDELTSGVAAGIAKLSGDERGYGDIYEDIHSAENARYNQYMEEHPGEALGLEMGGGFLSRRPAGLRAPALRQSARKLANIGRPGALKKATRRAGAKARLRAQEQKNQSIIQRGFRGLRKNMGEGMVEGAIAGAGASEDDWTEGAQMGAAFGAAIPGALNIGKTIGKGAFRRRIGEELGRGDRFKPLHLAVAEGKSTLADLYRTTIGRAYGARELLVRQEKKYLDRVQAGVDTADTAVERATDKVTRRAEKGADLKKTMGAERTEKVNALTDDYRLREQEVDDRIITDIDGVKLETETGLAKLQGLPEDLQKQESAALYMRALDNALPDHVPDKVKGKLMTMRPEDAREEVNKWWIKNAFKDVKKADIDWDGGDLWKDIDAALATDPRLALQVGRLVDKIPGMAKEMQRWAAKSGGKAVGGVAEGAMSAKFMARLFKNPRQINGDAFMELRNVFARKANATGDKGLRKVADQFDKSIRKELLATDKTGRLVEKFDHELSRWGTKVRFGDAVEKALKRKQGKFDINDWIDTRPKGRKPGDIDYQAMAAQETVTKAKESGAKQAARIKKTGQQKTGAKRKQKTKEKRALAKSKQGKLRTLAKDIEADPRKAKQEQKLLRDKRDKLAKQRKLKKARRSQTDINKRKLPPAGAPAMRAAGTSLLGAAASIPTMGLVGGLYGSFPAGLALGTTLSTPGLQRTMAGQNFWQKGGQKIGKKFQQARLGKAEELKLTELAKRLRESQTRYWSGRAGDR